MSHTHNTNFKSENALVTKLYSIRKSFKIIELFICI